MRTDFSTKSVLLGWLVIFLPFGGFAQTPPAKPPSAEVSAAREEIAKTPNRIVPYLDLATAELHSNHPDEAIAAANHALTMEYTEEHKAADFRPIAYDVLTLAYLQKGDITTALSQVEGGLNRYPGNPLLIQEKGLALLVNGQFSRASELFLLALDSTMLIGDQKALIAWGFVPDGADSGLSLLLAVSQYLAGQYPQALESARQLVALREKGTVCVNPALIQRGKKQCEELAGNGIHSIDGHDVSEFPDAGYVVNHYLSGPVGSTAEITYRERTSAPFVGHYTKTHRLQIVRQAIPLTKDDSDRFGLLALALNANGDKAQALIMAQKAIALNPDSYWTILPYGIVMEDSNRLDEALKALETPTTPSLIPLSETMRQNLLQIHRAVIYARKGDTAKAQEIYLSVAGHIDPSFMPAVKEKNAFLALVQPMVDAHLEKAKQSDAAGKYAESLPEYAQALNYAANEQEASTLRTAMFTASSKMPTPPEIPDEARRRVVRGELMLKDGQLDRALVEFNEALRMAPYVPKLYYNTALICGQLKQYDEAIRHMRLYLLAAPEAPDARAAQDEITKWEMRLEMAGKQ